MLLRTLSLFLVLITACRTTNSGTSSPKSDELGSKVVKYIEKKDKEGNFFPMVEGELGICSFNIKWLGHVGKQNETLADLLKNCDAIVIQELVVPFDVSILDKPPANCAKMTDHAKAGAGINYDCEAQAFFHAMSKIFTGVKLGEDSTSEVDPPSSATAAEWPVLFYNRKTIEVTEPNEFVSTPIKNGHTFDRVPYAFGLRAVGGGPDFIIVSVHLAADNKSGSQKKKRLEEFGAIKSWIEKWQKNSPERDIFIVGDTNIASFEELDAILSDQYLADFETLNPSLERTVVSTTSSSPFDQVFFNPRNLSLEVQPRLEIIDLRKVIPFEGTDRSFGFPYSDHLPIRFKIKNNPDND
ncbi:MAG: hypothetical protein AB7T49_10180 [Oligoflexales bacterium]